MQSKEEFSLIDYLNNEYGQLHEYESYDCEDGSGEGCQQAEKDEIELGQCDPSSSDYEECQSKYCSLGDIDCIEARDKFLFSDYLEQLVKENEDSK